MIPGENPADHLFDRRYISFTDEGKILISPTLDRDVLAKWSIDADHNVGKFTFEQRGYLEYHRDMFYRKTA